MFLLNGMTNVQKRLDYIKQIITTSPILAYLDPDKWYYLFTNSSKHSWSGILVQYDEQVKEDGKRIKYTPSHYIPEWHLSRLPETFEYTSKRSLHDLYVI